ncbi:MAG: efflux RND transporter periplasmic adaptor subunit [Bergeyella sp.]|nr:efflux RND transporter periplasmic adaptor subunit [Bergeyella sp.]
MNMYRKNRLGLSFWVLISVLGVVGCSKKSPDEKIKFSQQGYCMDKHLKSSITLSKAEVLPVQETITLTGEVQSNSDKTVSYVSLVDGVVTETFFSLGDYVRKGQLLANIKSTSINELQDDTETLNSQLSVAKRKLSSVESMYKDGIASQKDLEEARSEVAILQSNISKTRKNLQLYSAQNSSFRIKAPADGYVIQKNISNGTPVTAGGDPLFVISNLDKVWVTVNVYAKNMRNVYVGQPATIKTLAYPEDKFSGKINAISPVFDDDERVLKATIVMDNNNMKLRPGMSADIILPINYQNRNALAVPQKALVFDNNQNYIVVYKGDCHLEIRPVQEVASNENYSYVDGMLKEGEQIISSNVLLVYESLKNQTK